VGGRGWVDYARLRDVLDAALANRLPDVDVVTAGGPGVPALAASYARSRGLGFVAVPPDFEKHPGNARDRRDENVVGMADAAVVVWEDGNADVRDLLARVRAKGIPVFVLGAAARRERKRVEVPEPTPQFRGLPD
jgi:YspA, cpYpsA-related SLOG family